MEERLLITTAIGLMLGTSAFTQSPSDQKTIRLRGAKPSATTRDRRAFEPKIVDVLPRAGRSTADAPAPAPPSNRMTFSDKDREVMGSQRR